MKAEQTASNTRKSGYRLAAAGVLVAACVVALGAFTRLSDAGLGCPDWPGCYGHLTWPVEAHEVERANMLFPETPVEHDKTWPEMVHRYAAGALGLIIFALAFIAFRRRTDADYPFRMPMLMALLVVWQALFGMWTVTLKLWPQVVTIHLLGGMATFTLLWLLALRLGNRPWHEPARPRRKLRKLIPLAIVALVTVIVQIALGGWVAANYAAFGCPEIPTCRGEWWPPMDFIAGFNFFQDIGPNYLGGQLDNEARAAIHMAHRIGAIATALVLIALMLKTWRTGSIHARRLALVLAGLLVVQIVLGLSNVAFILPLPVAVAHNFVGALLLIATATLLLRARTALFEQPQPS